MNEICVTWSRCWSQEGEGHCLRSPLNSPVCCLDKLPTPSPPTPLVPLPRPPSHNHSRPMVTSRRPLLRKHLERLHSTVVLLPPLSLSPFPPHRPHPVCESSQSPRREWSTIIPEPTARAITIRRFCFIRENVCPLVFLGAALLPLPPQLISRGLTWRTAMTRCDSHRPVVQPPDPSPQTSSRNLSTVHFGQVPTDHQGPLLRVQVKHIRGSHHPRSSGRRSSRCARCQGHGLGVSRPRVPGGRGGRGGRCGCLGRGSQRRVSCRFRRRRRWWGWLRLRGGARRGRWPRLGGGSWMPARGPEGAGSWLPPSSDSCGRARGRAAGAPVWMLSKHRAICGHVKIWSQKFYSIYLIIN